MSSGIATVTFSEDDGPVGALYAGEVTANSILYSMIVRSVCA